MFEKIELPDGEYKGLWGGYQVEFETSEDNYMPFTEDGVRGFNIPVSVFISDGKVLVKHSQQTLNIVKIFKEIK